MAQRIVETSIVSFNPDGIGGWWMTSNITYTDTTRPVDDQMINTQVNVEISPTDTMAQFETNRSAAYRADMTARWGSAPATAILIQLKSV